jgi:hypothetical protein
MRNRVVVSLARVQSSGGGNISIQIRVNMTSATTKTTNIAATHNITCQKTAGLVHTQPPVLARTRIVKTEAATMAGRKCRCGMQTLVWQWRHRPWPSSLTWTSSLHCGHAPVTAYSPVTYSITVPNCRLFAQTVLMANTGDRSPVANLGRESPEIYLFFPCKRVHTYQRFETSTEPR